MNNKDKPAYPGVRYCTEKEDGTWDVRVSSGHTKLEEFTKAAMQGFCANAQYQLTSTEIARCAVEAAVETLAELEKRS